MLWINGTRQWFGKKFRKYVAKKDFKNSNFSVDYQKRIRWRLTFSGCICKKIRKNKKKLTTYTFKLKLENSHDILQYYAIYKSIFDCRSETEFLVICYIIKLLLVTHQVIIIYIYFRYWNRLLCLIYKNFDRFQSLIYSSFLKSSFFLSCI